MANSGFLEELPTEGFNPLPEPERRPAILVQLGIFIGSTALLAVLRYLGDAGFYGMESAYTLYGFYISLAMLLFFGIGLIVLAWFAADASGAYNAATRTAIRASQIVLVLAVALSKVCSN